MSVTKLGKYGPCSGRSGNCWVTVHLPLSGVPPFPGLGGLSWEIDEEAEVPHYHWVVDGLGDEPTFASLGMGWLGVGDSFSAYGTNADQMNGMGDPRSPVRFLKSKVVIETSAQCDLRSGAPSYGDKIGWNDSRFPFHETTKDLRVEWTWYYGPLDARVQAITVAGFMRMAGDAEWAPWWGGGSEGIFYTETLQEDGSYAKGGHNFGDDEYPWYMPFYDMLTTLLAVAADNGSNFFPLGTPLSGWSGSALVRTAVVSEAGGQYQYEGMASSPVEDFWSRITLVRESPTGAIGNDVLWEQPGSVESPEGLITMGDRLLSGYDLTDLSKLYPFHKEGTDEAVEVRFRPHHSYHVYPFFKTADGAMTKTLRWGCAEPDYKYGDYAGLLDPEAPGNDGTIRVIRKDDGVTDYPPTDTWVENLVGANGYSDDYANFNVVFPPYAARDLTRVGCIRYRITQGFFGGWGWDTPYMNGLNIASPLGGLGAGRDLDYPEAIYTQTAMAAWGDWIEVGKAAVRESVDACLVQFTQTERGHARASWALDDGETPNLSTAADPCHNAFGTGTFYVTRSALNPSPPTDPVYPTMGIAVVMRAEQRGAQLGSTAGLPPGTVASNVLTGWSWLEPRDPYGTWVEPFGWPAGCAEGGI